MRKFIKHLSLIIIAGLICYLFFDFGDYCSSVGLIFIIPFLIILFIINIVLLSIYNEHKNKKISQIEIELLNCIFYVQQVLFYYFF